MRCFFVSDLHGRVDRYEKLLRLVLDERPAAVFLGGDLLSAAALRRRGSGPSEPDFVRDFLGPGFARVRQSLGQAAPRVLLILGNDDPRSEEAAFVEVAAQGVWEYIHGRRVELGAYAVYGYNCVSPTPFRLKDWERYDVSRYVEPGCIPPEEGIHTVPVERSEIEHATIREDLEKLFGQDDLTRAIGLLHCPPHQSNLDRAALDGRTVDHAPVDVHVGSVAVRRFIERRQPLITLHGHIHESARITGSWRDRIGRTHLLSAAHDGPELALVRFDLENLEAADRRLI